MKTNVFHLLALLPYLLCTIASVWITHEATTQQSQISQSANIADHALAVAKAKLDAVQALNSRHFASIAAMIKDAQPLLGQQRQFVNKYARADADTQQKILEDLKTVSDRVAANSAAIAEAQKVYKPDQALAAAASAEWARLSGQRNTLILQKIAVMSPTGWRRMVKTYSPLTITPYLVVVFYTLAIQIKRKRRVQNGLCVDCGYRLTGNVSGTCPECGQTTART